MNFTYKDADLSKTIKSYHSCNGYYLINFLDGSVESYILKDNEEELIKHEMIKQAMEREEKYEKKRCMIQHQASSVIAILSAFSSVSAIENKNLLAIFEMIFITSFLNIVVSTEKLIELKKYKLYLELYQKIDKKKLEKLWQNYKLDEKSNFPEINSLDSVKYSHIKKFYKIAQNK